MKKHAYLIMAHNEFEILEKLLELIDDDRNDIYIHIDKKVTNFDFDYFTKIVKKSKLYFIKRIAVDWGGFSGVKCELNLLRTVLKVGYEYYHLISGVDLPLKTQDEIHNFFAENQGYEFVHFCTMEKIAENRILHYHLMKRYQNKWLEKIRQKVYPYLCKIQEKYNFKRKWDKSRKIMYGANWFSITDELARYIVNNEKWISKYFKYTLCADESFVQTLIQNSNFMDRLYHKEIDGNYAACVRYIDWNRGNPYVFKREDFSELINSDRLFARKFSSNIDSEIIEMIYSYLKTKGNDAGVKSPY